MNKYSRSRTSLFLMEFVITVFLFAVCGAVCVKLFVRTQTLEKDTYELNHAVMCAQGFAEVMRGTDGDMESIIMMYPEAVKGSDTYFEVFYDKNFQRCEYAQAVYCGEVTLSPVDAIQNMDVRIVRMNDYKEIFTLTATKYMNDPKG